MMDSLKMSCLIELKIMKEMNNGYISNGNISKYSFKNHMKDGKIHIDEDSIE
jgi:hypothetical protein